MFKDFDKFEYKPAGRTAPTSLWFNGECRHNIQ